MDESSTSASQGFSPSFAVLYKSLPKKSGSLDKDFMVVCGFELWFRKCVRVSITEVVKPSRRRKMQMGGSLFRARTIYGI